MQKAAASSANPAQPGPLRSWLNGLYRSSAVLAIVLLIAIGGLTLSQMVARLFGANVPSADDFAAFCMAGSLFLGLAYTYRSGGHVRVQAIRQRLSAGARRPLEIACLVAAAATLAWLLWFTQDMVRVSYEINEKTIGLIPTPKWIPMLGMLVGVAVLLIAVLDDLFAVARGGRASYADEDDKTGLPSVTAE